MAVQPQQKLGNTVFLPTALDYLNSNLEGACFRLSPTAELRKGRHKERVAASDLLVGEKDGTEHAHFRKFEVEQDVREWLKDSLEQLFKEHENKLPSQVFTPIAVCMGTILKKVSMLHGGYAVAPADITKPCTIHTEAELRFAIVDPIIEMLCASWGYQVRLEETVKSSNAPSPVVHPTTGHEYSPPRTRAQGLPTLGTPGTNTSSSISEGSRADYSLYILKNNKETVVAVLLEAKLTTHKTFHHALGQLLGYYVKFASDEGDPPLCALVSERMVQLLYFPYILPEGTPVVDCVVFPELPLFLEMETAVPTSVNTYLLALLLLLCSTSPNNIIPFHKKQKIKLTAGTKKVTIKAHINTATEQLQEQLEEARQQVQQEQAKRQQLEKMLVDLQKKALQRPGP